MEADYECLEIVFVIDAEKLIDAESYERRYRPWDGLPLGPGYYVVRWPEEVRARRFNEQACFHGPYPCRRDAQARLERLLLAPSPNARAAWPEPA